MHFALDSRVAVVTGAGTGLGRAIALGYAEAGANIVLAGRTRRDLEAVAAEIRGQGREALAVPTDVTDPNQVERLAATALEHFAQVDILVNNAGAALHRVPALELTDQQWQEELELNLTAVFRCCRTFGRHMVTRGSGKVVNLASLAAKRASARGAGYCSAKAGVVMLTQVLAVEWARHGIGVNCIAPGFFDTRFNDGIRDEPALRDRLLQRIPLRRMGRPEDLVGLAVFLGSPASNYLTGETIYIDGGWGAGL